MGANDSRPLREYFVADAVPIAIIALALCLATSVLLCCFRCDRGHVVKKDVIFLMSKVFSFLWSSRAVKKKSDYVKALETVDKNTKSVTGGINAKDSSKRVLKPDNLDNGYIIAMYMIAACLSLLFIFTVFWDTFLIKRRQDNCVEGLNCYLIESAKLVPSNEPLNCSEFEMSEVENMTGIVCYKFVLDIGQAYADAGGALAGIGVEFLLGAALFNKISDGVLKLKKVACCSHGCVYACIHIVQSIAGLIIFFLFVFPSLLDIILNKMVTDIPKLLSPFILFFQIMVIANIPWYLVSSSDEKSSKNKDENSSKNKDENSSKNTRTVI